MFLKMLKYICAAVIVTAIMSPPSAPLAAEKYPSSWRKTMTRDPATNVYLAKFTATLGDRNADLLRTVILSLAIGKLCDGVKLNRTVGKKFLVQSGYFKIKGKAWKDADFLAEDSLRYLDYEAVAHLCAGTDYLFGSHGVLAANLILAGTGEPRNAYDPTNPYIRLPPLREPK